MVVFFGGALVYFLVIGLHRSFLIVKLHTHLVGLESTALFSILFLWEEEVPFVLGFHLLSSFNKSVFLKLLCYTCAQWILNPWPQLAEL